ncbi:twin-arginine translocase TatA/TatE family subunit [Fodinicurvata sp. EGI_FJ10296]|uniref:twin-arginine translocase TatA/TatE family subunit n=1 Tax=Fodinicurvata sp. EGI_FJ10296 TaxID=3231908 RepID=UPI003454FCC5
MGLGVWQVVLILVIVLIIFGAGKLPRVMGDVAKGVKNFRSGLKEEDEADDGTNPNRQLDEDGRPTTTSSSTVQDSDTQRDGVSKP